MTQEIPDRATAGAEGADSRTAELEAALRERTKEQKLSARQLQLAESRLEHAERERDELLDQISGLEADIETSRATFPSAQELARERERHAAELEAACQQLEAAREDAALRLRETEELRDRLRSLEGRDVEQQSLLGQVAALEEELAVLRKQNRDLEELVLNANTEVQRSRKQADDLWQKVTGGHPPVKPEGPAQSEQDEPVPSNDDSPDQESVQIRGGDLSQLVDDTGELEPTQARPPIDSHENDDGTVDPREMMKDTAELVGDDPIQVPDELREITAAEQERRDASEPAVRAGRPEVEVPDQSRLMAILGGEGTVDGDAPWESESGDGRLADPSFTEAPTRAHRPLAGGADSPREEPVEWDASEHLSRSGAASPMDDTPTGEAVVEGAMLEGALAEEESVEEEVEDQEEEIVLPPPVEFLEEPAAMPVAAEPEPVRDDFDSAEPAQTLGIEDLDRQDEFQRLLLDGARFHRTDRFGKVDLVNRIDIQISDWLASSDDLDEINEVSGGRMAKARLLEVLWVFFQRRMFRLEEI